MGRISTEQWRQAFALLDEAIELPSPARAEWLSALTDPPIRTALQELLALRERQSMDGFMQRLPQFTVTPDDATSAEAADMPAAGDNFGPYRLLSQLGRGGMSSVWVAERTDGLLKRRVALKLPHVSWPLPDLAGRMARERDILASLEHPNIARLYDAGITDDGRPYLALELVDGKPIDEYCSLHDADVAARVAVVLQTAAAVAYAHSRMVVHRDLKPSNILVDNAGKVHLLDFGISKLLAQDTDLPPQATQFGARAYTPDYASPEQIRGESVTASSDVYSLGVVLYQLLSGSLPVAARERGSITDDPMLPAPPSAVAGDRATARALRGDLDTIVMKALKDSATERYAGMQLLADDLERFLRGAPVLARRDSIWYRANKSARRNRFALRAVVGAVAITAAVSGGLAIQKSRQQSAATQRAIESYADNMAQLVVPRTPPTKDAVAYREYLQARGIMVVPTEANLREVIRLTRDVTARDPKFAQAYAVLAGANLMYLDNGYARPDALRLADEAAREALALSPHHHGALATLGVIAAHRGDWLAAEQTFRRAFEYDDGSGRIHARYAEAVLNSTGRLQEAVRVYRTELLKAPTHCRASMQLAVILGTQPGREAEAARYIDVAISHGWPGDSVDVQQLNGTIARRAGRYAEAAEYQLSTIPAATRQAGGAQVVRLLHEALATSALRPNAVVALDELNGPGAAAGMESFDMLMFSMSWYTLLGDVDRAYRVSDRWLEESRRTGRSGIPFVLGFWQPEMRAFRADPRFQELMRRMGLVDYWTKFGPPDGCRLQGGGLSCESTK
jgi:serine/threonine protein kinase/Tfp pilus assembly protein PilF